MAVYFITGKLGAGKTLCAVGRIQDAIMDGKRVATNLDLFMEHYYNPRSKHSPIRLPDKPRVQDFEMLGRGHDLDHPDETKNGIIVLDECLDFLDSRSWRDPERAPVLSWMRHARKHRWDIYFLLQDIESADGQLKRQLCEHFVMCRRLDRVKVGPIRLPKVHVAQVYYGESASGSPVDRWIYKSKDLYKLYDTEQCFTDQVEFLNLPNGTDNVDFRAPYSYLSPWHLKGRYLEPPKKKKPLKALLLHSFALSAFVISYLIGLAVPRLRPYFWVS